MKPITINSIEVNISLLDTISAQRQLSNIAKGKEVTTHNKGGGDDKINRLNTLKHGANMAKCLLENLKTCRKVISFFQI